MNANSQKQGMITVIGCLLLALLLAAFFGSILVGQSQFGFRDTASYYAPIYEWVANQRLVDDSIEWSPNDNWGGPVLADSTPGAYYPPQLLFLLKPFVSFSVLLGWFALLHVVWALLGTLVCCKKLKMGRLAAWLTALSFAFGGTVLFQSCNLIFLISAAWLPWAMAAIIGLSSEGRLIHLPWLAICMASMILAGDPQMAVHVALLMLAAWVLFSINPSGFGQGEIVSENGVFSKKLGLLAVAIVTVATAALAMVQIGPSVEWAQHSERSAKENETNFVAAKFARPELGTHRDAVYQFSLPPWSVAEMLWPNALGKMDYGTNLRWSSRLPGSDRIWTGSLYGGAFMFLLAITNFWKRRDGRRRRDRIDRFLFGGAIFFVVAAFGWYGIGWLINELNLMRGGTGISHWLGEPVGGLYWFLECLLPGYSSFRYPAKLAVVGSLFLSLSAGRGMDRLLFESSDAATTNTATTRSYFAFVVNSLSIVSVGSLLVAVATWTSSFVAANEVCVSLCHTIVVLMLFGLFLWFLRGRPMSASIGLLCLLAADLSAANYWLVAKTTTETPEFAYASPLFEKGETIFRSESTNDYSAFRNGDELAAQLRLDKRSLYPKHHLNQDVRVVGSFHSIQPLDTSLLLQAMNGLSDRHLESVCESLSIDGRVVAASSFKKTRFKVEPFNGRSRFYLTSSWSFVEPVDSKDRAAVAKQTERFINWCVSNRNELVQNQMATPVLIEAEERELAKSFGGLSEKNKPSTSPPSVKVVEATAGRIELKLTAGQPMLLVAADYFHPNWKVHLYNDEGRFRELPTFRVNRVLRGVPIPAGEHTVELFYQAGNSFRNGLTSCLAWVTVLLSMLALRRRAQS